MNKRKLKSCLHLLQSILTGKKKAVMDKTNPMLAILEPITLPTETSWNPLKAAFKLTTSSGKEVAKDIMTIPTNKEENLKIFDNIVEPLTKRSPPKANKITPIKKNI